MVDRMLTRIAMVGMLLVAFTVGYTWGSLSQPLANAQIPGGMLDKAKGGSPLAAAGQLGSSITEMEQHVSGLQKNLDTLRKIQSALKMGQ